MDLGPPRLEAAATPDEPTMKLARVMHLEWCPDENDWRPLGHGAADHPDTSGKAGAIQARLEAETYPTIG